MRTDPALRKKHRAHRGVARALSEHIWARRPRMGSGECKTTWAPGADTPRGPQDKFWTRVYAPSSTSKRRRCRLANPRKRTAIAARLRARIAKTMGRHAMAPFPSKSHLPPATCAIRQATRLGSKASTVAHQLSPARDAHNPSHRSLGRPFRRFDQGPSVFPASKCMAQLSTVERHRRTRPNTEMVGRAA